MSWIYFNANNNYIPEGYLDEYNDNKIEHQGSFYKWFLEDENNIHNDEVSLSTIDEEVNKYNDVIIEEINVKGSNGKLYDSSLRGYR